LRRRRLVLVVLFRWFPVGDRVHHFEGGCCAEQNKKKFGEKMKQTLEKKKRDESA
jgi:hypothetical protein